MEYKNFQSEKAFETILNTLKFRTFAVFIWIGLA